MANQKSTPVVFEGKTSEYFGIWIVNLLLSIITLGIYSAWAKVRRKKYFYNNTLIDNVGFDYHANPKAILKGRLIAVAFYAFYQAVGGTSPILALICMLVFLVALPWIVVRSATFNARNTSHRGLRFDFVGQMGQAAYVFMLLPILTGLTLGALYPYFMQQKNKFLMSHHRFGLSQFKFSATAGQFYRVYWLPVMLYVLFVVGILAAIAIPQYKMYQEKAKAAAQRHSQLNVPFVMGFADTSKIVVAANDVVEPVERVYSENQPAPGAAEMPAEPALPEQAGAEPVPEADAGAISQEELAMRKLEEISKLDPAEQEKAMQEWMKEQQAAGGMEGLEGEEMGAEEDPKTAQEHAIEDFIKKSSVGVIGFVFLFYGAIFALAAYIQSRAGNLAWNSTTLDNLSFKSSLRARDFMWLYFTNLLAIGFTFGLATPWAQIRMARYRASKLEVIGDVDFDQFVGDKKEKMAAAGEEIAEFFDVDLSFG